MASHSGVRPRVFVTGTVQCMRLLGRGAMKPRAEQVHSRSGLSRCISGAVRCATASSMQHRRWPPSSRACRGLAQAPARRCRHIAPGARRIELRKQFEASQWCIPIEREPVGRVGGGLSRVRSLTRTRVDTGVVSCARVRGDGDRSDSLARSPAVAAAWRLSRRASARRGCQCHCLDAQQSA